MRPKITIGDEIIYSVPPDVNAKRGIVKDVTYAGWAIHVGVVQIDMVTRLPTGMEHQVSVNDIDCVMDSTATEKKIEAYDRAMRGI